MILNSALAAVRDLDLDLVDGIRRLLPRWESCVDFTLLRTVCC